MMEGNTWDQFTEIILASMNLAVSRLNHERYPDQPYGSDQIEYAEENLFRLCEKLVTPEEPDLDSDSPEGERVMATLERVEEITTFPVDPSLRMTDDEVLDLVHGSPDPSFANVWTPEHLKHVEFMDQPEWEKDPFASKDDQPEHGDDSFGGEIQPNDRGNREG